MKTLAENALDLLDGGQSFVLATILTQRGSAPRSAGSRMLIAAGRKIYGTIGGGVLEARAMDGAEEILQGGPCRILGFDLSNRDAAGIGMICGGRVDVLLDLIRPSEENRAIFRTWQKALLKSEKCLFVTAVRPAAGKIDSIEHCLILADGARRGQLPLSAEALQKLIAACTDARFMQVMNLEGALVVVEPGLQPPTLYIIGAGHVAQPTAHLAALVGFRVEVLDDRAEFANAARFPGAEVKVMADFDSALVDVLQASGAYIVIVTRGHLHDQSALSRALKTEAAYIGMIGSRRKRDTVYANLLKQGFSEADLKRVHCPIGLDIGAETPAEIAVSIIAELIRARARLG